MASTRKKVRTAHQKPIVIKPTSKKMPSTGSKLTRKPDPRRPAKIAATGRANPDGASIGLADRRLIANSGAPELTLEDAIALTLANNPQRQEAQAAVNGATAKIGAVGAAGKLQVGANGTTEYGRNTSTSNALAMADTGSSSAGTSGGTTGGDAGNGGSGSGDSGTGGTGTGDTSSSAASPSRSFLRFDQLTVNATLPITTGGRVRASTRQARYQAVAQIFQLAQVEQDLILSTTLAYLDVLRSTQLLRVTNANLAVSQERLRVARLRFSVGASAQLDVLQAETDLSDARSRRIQAVNALGTSNSSLNILLGRAPETPIRVVPISRLNLPDVAYNVRPNSVLTSASTGKSGSNGGARTTTGNSGAGNASSGNPGATNSTRIGAAGSNAAGASTTGATTAGGGNRSEGSGRNTASNSSSNNGRSGVSSGTSNAGQASATGGQSSAVGPRAGSASGGAGTSGAAGVFSGPSAPGGSSSNSGSTSGGTSTNGSSTSSGVGAGGSVDGTMSSGGSGTTTFPGSTTAQAGSSASGSGGTASAGGNAASGTSSGSTTAGSGGSSGATGSTAGLGSGTVDSGASAGLQSLAGSTRQSLAVTQAQIGAAEAAVDIAKSGKKPQLGLNLTALLRNPATFLGNFGASIGLGLAQNLFDSRRTKEQVNVAESALDQLRARLAGQRLEVANAIETSLLTLDSAQRREENSASGVRSATEALRVATLGFRSGVRTTLDLADAQAALLSAQTDAVNARFDVADAQAALAAAVGIYTVEAQRARARVIQQQQEAEAQARKQYEILHPAPKKKKKAVQQRHIFGRG